MKITAYLVIEPVYSITDKIVGGHVAAVRKKLPKTLHFGARPVKVTIDLPPEFWDAPAAEAVVEMPDVDVTAEATPS